MKQQRRHGTSTTVSFAIQTKLTQKVTEEVSRFVLISKDSSGMPKAASDGMARYLCCAASQGVSCKLPKFSDNLLKQKIIAPNLFIDAINCLYVETKG